MTHLHFHHRSGGGGGAGQAAKDATGADIKAKVRLKTHLLGDHPVPGPQGTCRGVSLNWPRGCSQRAYPRGVRTENALIAAYPSEAYGRTDGRPGFPATFLRGGRAASWHPIACLRRLERANSMRKMGWKD